MVNQKMHNQLIISIIGPTGVGKTAAAWWLAQQLITKRLVKGVDLIVVDSRQVYRGLTTITSADLPSGVTLQSSRPITFATTDKSIIWHGVGIIAPTADWSVVDFQRLAVSVLDQSKQNSRLPILVGGSWLYHRQWSNLDLATLPGPDLELRSKLAAKSTMGLQDIVRRLNPERWNQLNRSDQHNPRRLIRAIEQALRPDSEKARYNRLSRISSHQIMKIVTNGRSLMIGLNLPWLDLTRRIKARVEQRWHSAVTIEEVKQLAQLVPDRQRPIWSAMGISEIDQWLTGRISGSECLAKWQRSEINYAKRQLKWWQDDVAVNWLTANHPNFYNQLWELVTKKWQPLD